MVFISMMTMCSVVMNRLFAMTSPLHPMVSVVLNNPFIGVIGVGDYLCQLCVREGIESGVWIANKDHSSSGNNKNQWILLTLLLDRILFITYILFLISIYT